MKVVALVSGGMDSVAAHYGEKCRPFAETKPTAEVLEKTFFDEIAGGLAAYARRTDTRYKLRPSVRLVKVRVWETNSS